MKIILSVVFMDWIILVTTISAYGILIIETFRGKGIKSQSFFTYLLWAILDIIVFITIQEENSSSLVLVFSCVFCSVLMSILLFKYDKSKKWGDEETRTLFSIVIVVLIWIFSKSNILTLALAIIAELIAGWPQMKRSWKNPGTRMTLVSYSLFLIIYILSVFNSPDWQLKNVLFPIAFFIYCIGDTFPLIKKWWKIERRYIEIKKLSYAN